jgi:hypothetical protein
MGSIPSTGLRFKSYVIQTGWAKYEEWRQSQLTKLRQSREIGRRVQNE